MARGPKVDPAAASVRVNDSETAIVQIWRFLRRLAAHEALGVTEVALVEDPLSRGDDGGRPTVLHVDGVKQREAGVVVLGRRQLHSPTVLPHQRFVPRASPDFSPSSLRTMTFGDATSRPLSAASREDPWVGVVQRSDRSPPRSTVA